MEKEIILLKVRIEELDAYAELLFAYGQSETMNYQNILLAIEVNKNILEQKERECNVQ